VGVLAVLVTGWQASRRAEAALHQASINQLTLIRDERRRQIETFFANVRRDGLTLAESRDITAAMPRIEAAYRALQAEVARWPASTRAGYRKQVHDYYGSAFVPRLQALEARFGLDDTTRYLPTEDASVVLQALFIADNPNPEASRDSLDRPAGGGRYTEIHAQLNPFIRSITRQFGYSDLFLIAQDGRIVYTVAKKVDFGTNLLTGPYRDSRLRRAFQAARSAIDADFVQLVDFESYVPGLGAPTAFVVAPIFAGGQRLGVLALQIPLDRIDAVMTGGRNWEAQGLGRTGETYLIGPDYRMRSASRSYLETPREHLDALAQAGVPPERIRLIEAHASTVLFQEITTEAAQAALRGETGTLTQRDYRAAPGLAAYAPLTVGDLTWGIVAKMDVAEAFAPAVALRRALQLTAAGVAAVVIAMAVVLARSLTAPIRRLIGGMEVLGQGDLSHRLTEARRDEIGQIATAFNRMAGDLQETTVSRDHVNSILDAMSDAVIVVRPPAEGAEWSDAVIVTVNPAACAMLGRTRDAIVGQPVGGLIGAITGSTDAAPGDAGLWLQEILRHGQIGSREVLYKIRDGREIPVLFSGAVMRQGMSAVQGIVWAAHDLTEVKALEARSTFIRETFGRYVSDDVVAGLLSSPEALKLGGELRKVTVMMTDLRGFTALAERLTPEQAITFLNGYLHTMVDLILRHRGTINEILGDGILVIFGAPTHAADDAERAVACAVAMQLAMDEVNARSGLPPVEMGIGVHTGEVIVGNIGSERRMKYAAVGSHVNLTGRIESYTTGGQILISEDTMREVAPVVTVGRRLRVEPKGAKRAMTVFEVTGIGGRHGLALPVGEPPLVDLPEPIAVRYAVLEGKHVAGTLLEGRLARLSMHGAHVQASDPPAPLSNVKIGIVDPAAGLGELYAKVVDTATDGFVVRFTSIGPEIARYLDRHTTSAGTTIT
jgi:PAS domain S-box-containing protein